ncbi:hypothetical protein Tco_1183236 [Tanacetum coccineum]
MASSSFVMKRYESVVDTMPEALRQSHCALYDVGAVMVVHAVIMDCKLMLEKSSNNYVRFYTGAMPIFKAYGDSSFQDYYIEEEERHQKVQKSKGNHWPVLLRYAEVMSSDFVEDFYTAEPLPLDVVSIYVLFRLLFISDGRFIESFGDDETYAAESFTNDITSVGAGLAKLQTGFGADRIADAHLLAQAEQRMTRISIV